MPTVRKIKLAAKKDGTQAVRYQVFFIDAAGKRTTKSFKKQAEARAYAAEVGTLVKSGYQKTDVTVKDACEIFLQASEIGRQGKPPLEQHTLRSYRALIQNHILPRIANLYLSDLSPQTISAFRDSLLETETRSIAKRSLSLLKTILTEAKTRGLISSNPAEGITVSVKTGRHSEDIEIPTRAEVDAILQACDKLAKGDFALAEKRGAGDAQKQQIARAWQRYRPMIYLARFSGIRSSELRGLCWSAIDFKSSCIKITQRADEKGNLGPTKSKNSRRSITIPSLMLSMLTDYKKQSTEHDLVFTNNGGPIDHGNFSRRAWWRCCELAGVLLDTKPLTYHFHALRHFYASDLIAAGADLKTLQSLLGHDDPAFTLRQYGHLLPDDESKRRDLVEKLARVVE